MSQKQKKLTPLEVKKMEEKKKNKALTGQIIHKNDRDTRSPRKGIV